MPWQCVPDQSVPDQCVPDRKFLYDASLGQVCPLSDAFLGRCIPDRCVPTRWPTYCTGGGQLAETWVTAVTLDDCALLTYPDTWNIPSMPSLWPLQSPLSVRDGSYKDPSSEGRIVQGSHRFSRMMWSKHVWRLQAILFNVNGCLNLPSTACFMMNRTFHLKLKSYAVNCMYVEQNIELIWRVHLF